MLETIEQLPLINLYCDESCHLPNDHQPNMVLGVVVCAKKDVRACHVAIREIKARHGMVGKEIKWNKVHKNKLAFYEEVITYFFNTPALRFRSVIARKNGLNHEAYNQTHDKWYYIMYYYLLNGVLSKRETFHIFIDIKDSCGSIHRQNLKKIICNKLLDFDMCLIKDIQATKSDQVELVQLADLLIGCLMHANDNRKPSPARDNLVELVKKLSRYSLKTSTTLGESKFNLFHWCPRGNQ
jgi:hypothetical protein